MLDKEEEVERGLCTRVGGHFIFHQKSYLKTEKVFGLLTVNLYKFK